MIKILILILMVLVSIPLAFVALYYVAEIGTNLSHPFTGSLFLILIAVAVLFVLLLVNWNKKAYWWIAVAYVVIASGLVLSGFIYSYLHDKEEFETFENFVDQRAGVYSNDNLDISINGIEKNKNDIPYINVTEKDGEGNNTDLKLFHYEGSFESGEDQRIFFSESNACKGRSYGLMEDDKILYVWERVEGTSDGNWECEDRYIGEFKKS